MSLRTRVEDRLWPLVQGFLDENDAAGLAVAVVREGEVVSRGFGVRDVRTGASVTPETMFHLASVSKPFVATGIVLLATARGDGEPAIDLDAPIVDLIPEFALADGRAGEVTARGLLSHSSGLPDVSDYGWHDPQAGDDALSELARSLSGWRLRPGNDAAFSYSNAGFDLLGLLMSRATGTTFEQAVRRLVLAPLGMRRSTFLRTEVPAHLAASPHVGMPLQVPDGAYPYTRRHAPSSTLHSNLEEMCRWMEAHLDPGDAGAGGADEQAPRLGTDVLEVMWRPVVSVGRPPWEEAAALGWSTGSYRGLRTLSHNGLDPGFGSKLVLVPERRTGVVVLANSNTVPSSAIAAAALDVALDVALGDPPVSTSPGVPPEEGSDLRALLPSVVGPVAHTLATSGPDAAAQAFHRSAASDPAAFDLDDECFVDAVWGAIELHRTSMVWPLLRLWTSLRPGSSSAWTMTGWAHQVDGRPREARSLLQRALDLDPGNEEAALMVSTLPPG